MTQGGELLLPPGIALEVITALEEGDVAVIGVEAVRVTPNGTEPDLDHIADCADLGALTWELYRQAANRCARGFIAQLPARADLFVSLVAQERKDWQSL